MAHRRWKWIIVPPLIALSGCVQAPTRPEYLDTERLVHAARHHPGTAPPPCDPTAVALDPMSIPADLLGPQPVDVFIRRALAENRVVQAARFNVLALGERIPQVTSLDDPVVSNTFYPSSTNGLQTADGFMPWNMLIAQQFPWFGTLRLRGEAAEQDVQVALAELCAAQLDTVEEVKRAYFDLYFNEQAERILQQNRSLVSDFIETARYRYENSITDSLQEVLRAEVLLASLDRELIEVRRSATEARAALAQLLHVSPDAPLQTLPGVPTGDVPVEIDRLYRLAVAARPELRGRLAAVVRDQAAVELARKRYKPDVTLGVNYMLMTTSGAVSQVAKGNDNIGMFVGFNLPVYRKKLDGAVGEAEARAVADAKLYEAERDGAFREIKDLMTQVRAQQETIGLFQNTILPRSQDALDVSKNDYQTGSIDYISLITAWREVLQIELQVAQVEAELGKAIASLERAVGVELNAHPPAPETSVPSITPLPPPVPADEPGPFLPESKPSEPITSRSPLPPRPDRASPAGGTVSRTGAAGASDGSDRAAAATAPPAPSSRRGRADRTVASPTGPAGPS